MEIKELRIELEKINKMLNEWVSKGIFPLMEKAYPNFDGNADAEVISEMMLLRDEFISMKNACAMGIFQLTDVIGDED